jgi:hypothetical protein
MIQVERAWLPSAASPFDQSAASVVDLCLRRDAVAASRHSLEAWHFRLDSLGQAPSDRVLRHCPSQPQFDLRSDSSDAHWLLRCLQHQDNRSLHDPIAKASRLRLQRRVFTALTSTGLGPIEDHAKT